jgi:hypothetical protein
MSARILLIWLSLVIFTGEEIIAYLLQSYQRIVLTVLAHHNIFAA